MSLGCPDVSAASKNALRVQYRKLMKISLVIKADPKDGLRRAHDMMARMSTGKVEQRIAAVLLILMDSCGIGVEGGTRLNVPLTRQDISEMAGTTVETTIRVMSKWQKANLIETAHQVITINQPEALQRALIE